jgi:hypothetical protein
MQNLQIEAFGAVGQKMLERFSRFRRGQYQDNFLILGIPLNNATTISEELRFRLIACREALNSPSDGWPYREARIKSSVAM